MDYAHKEKLKGFKVFNLGNSLDGFLRDSQLWTLQVWCVPESAVIYNGSISGKWLRRLSDEFDIEYYQTNTEIMVN